MSHVRPAALAVPELPAESQQHAADAIAAPSTDVNGFTMIAAPGPWPHLDARELWRFRELLGFLVWRDIRVRYAQTVLGVTWTVLQPALTALIFTVVFGIFARVPSDNVPYPLFALAALVPWTYFAAAFATAANSLVDHANLIGKVYFQRLIVPVAAVCSALVDFAISMVLLFLLMAWYGVLPGSAVLLLPFLILLLIVTATGIGCWLAALNVRYRDVRYAIPFLVQIWMYASPIVYPMSLVPERFRLLYALNPMAGIIEGFRSALLGTGAVSWGELAVSFLSALVLFTTGIFYFLKREQVFADVV